MSSNLVRFDWAAKRLLRQKSNFVVLEGLLSTLLNEDIRIVRMLESEGNQESSNDKFNRVDMLAEDSKGELIIIEVQNNRELSYFHRMLYGVSKAITEYIWKGDEYEKIKKLYSVNIVYFDLGQGEDYVYRGHTTFTGIYKNDVLQLSERQREQFTFKDVGDLFPEYYVIRVNEFNENAVTSLDEWILFLKTGEISENANAKGLAEARERLQEDRLSKEERASYNAHLESVRYEKSVIETSLIEGKAIGLEEGKVIGLEEGKVIGLEEANVKFVIASVKAGLSLETIANITGLTTDQVSEIIKNNV